MKLTQFCLAAAADSYHQSYPYPFYQQIIGIGIVLDAWMRFYSATFRYMENLDITCHAACGVWDPAQPLKLQSEGRSPVVARAEGGSGRDK